METSGTKIGPLRRGRFFIFFFLYLLVYHVVVVNRLAPWSVNRLTYSVYRVDYSFGFGSKFLPGALFDLLFGQRTSEKATTIFCASLVVIIFAGVSFLLERFMLRVRPENRNAALFTAVVFLSGSYTFCIYTRYLGLLDTWWLLFSILFLLFLENKRLRFLIPAVFVLSLLIHFSALVFIITFYSIVLLYRISVAGTKRERSGLIAVLCVSLLLTAGLFMFLVLYESRHIVPMEEFHNKLLERGESFFNYWDYSIFHIWEGKLFVPESVNDIGNPLIKFAALFYYQAKMALGIVAGKPGRSIAVTLSALFLLLPPYLAAARFHRRRCAGQTGALGRICSFLMIVQFPFVFCLGVLFGMGIDMTRYLTHGFTVTCMCLLYVLYSDPEANEMFFEALRPLKGSMPTAVWFSAYFLTAMDPLF
ncbi:MAG: hypothetical protein K6C36_04575 [Clostridia bacterium]|nr:hypothetical protein [Clostridia bacterium]